MIHKCINYQLNIFFRDVEIRIIIRFDWSKVKKKLKFKTLEQNCLFTLIVCFITI